jgi:hypothetical protein
MFGPGSRLKAAPKKEPLITSRRDPLSWMAV